MTRTTISHIGGVVERLREDFLGSDGTGNSGEANRVYTLATLFVVTIVEVFLDGVLLTEDNQYTYNSTNKQITILIPVWDDQLISIFYEV